VVSRLMLHELGLDISYAFIISIFKGKGRSRYHCVGKNSKTGWRRFACAIEEADRVPERTAARLLPPLGLVVSRRLLPDLRIKWQVRWLTLTLPQRRTGTRLPSNYCWRRTKRCFPRKEKTTVTGRW